jgi:glucose-1-phosphate cytidylyltransferase
LFFDRRFLPYLSAEDSCILEREPLVRLANDGELMLFKHRGFWACMDTQRDREYLDGLWSQKAAPWAVSE